MYQRALAGYEKALGPDHTSTLEKAARREKGGMELRIEEERRDAQRASSKHGTLLEFLQTNILRPFHLPLTEPVVFFFALLSALSYGITFISTQSIPQVYRTTYAFTEPLTGYVQGAIVLGELVGWTICVCIQDPFYARCARRALDDAELRRTLPEKRLYAAIPASFLALAAGLFIYGFSSHAAIPLYLPILGLFLIGIGVVVVMQAIVMYDAAHLLVLGAKTLLFQLLNHMSHTHHTIQNHISHAMSILRTGVMGQPCKQFFCSPLPILSSVLQYPEDIALVQNELQVAWEISAVVMYLWFFKSSRPYRASGWA